MERKTKHIEKTSQKNKFNLVDNETTFSVYKQKYQINDEKIDDTYHRISSELDRIIYGRMLDRSKLDNLSFYGKELYNNIINNKFTSINDISFDRIIPGGSGVYGIGNNDPEKISSLSNCFVIDYPYDSYEGINYSEEELVTLGKVRGGVGINLSTIRPKNSKINNQAKSSSGVCTFVNEFSEKNNSVAQNGRRGALMICLDVRHPDILDFIRLKDDISKVTGANLSVLIDDEFMNAVEKDDLYVCKFPVDSNFKSKINKNIDYDHTLQFDKKSETYYKIIPAKEIWDAIIYFAHKVAEPGVLFKDAWFKGGTDGCYKQFAPISCNPCLVGDTDILTDEGYKYIIDRVGKKTNVFNGLEYTEVVPTKTAENQEIYEVGFGNGSKIGCTIYHKFPIWHGRSYNGYSQLTELKNIKVGDRIEGFKLPNSIDNSKYNHLNGIITITSIIKTDRVEDVYCLNEPKRHKFVANGILTGNCSEISMGPNDSCRLISYNLKDSVIKPYTKTSEINIEYLYKIFYNQMLYADCIIDLELEKLNLIITKIQKDNCPYYLKYRPINLFGKMIQNTSDGRRCGCGLFGVGDMIAMLGLSFKDNKTKAILEKLLTIKFKAELDCSTDLAVLYGSFKGYDYNIDIKQEFWKNKISNNEFDSSIKRMKLFGRRNVSWSTVAPTGTLSMLGGATSGIEPLFEPYYTRKIKSYDDENYTFVDADGQKFVEHYICHPTFIEWYAFKNKLTYQDAENMLINSRNIDEIFSKSPWYKNIASDLAWKDRLDIQAIIQQYTTHSISSTINLPNDVDIKVVDNIYKYSHSLGLKGNTVYRDGSRSGILTKPSATTNKKRSTILKSILHKLSYKNKTYGILIGFQDDKPYELFIISGLGFIKHYNREKFNGITIKDVENVYSFFEDESDIQTQSDIDDGSDLIALNDLNSLETNEEKLISLFISKMLRNGSTITSIKKLVEKSEPIASTFAYRLNKILSIYTEPTNDLCPVCGSKLICENGCFKCRCGWSKC